MAKFVLPHFGELDLDSPEAYYDGEIEFNGKAVRLDMSFDNETIDAQRLEVVKGFLEKLPEWNEKNNKAILKDYKDEDGNTVRDYLEFILEELDKGELSKLINLEDKSVKPIDQLLKKLHLVRVGLYPDGEDAFAIFDYSIGKDVLDHVVVLSTDEKGKLEYMTMES